MKCSLKKLLLFSIVLLCSANIFGQERQTGTFTYVAKNGKHTAKLIITVKPFNRTKHKLTFADEQYLKDHHYSISNTDAPMVIEIDRQSTWYGIDSTTLERLSQVREIVDMSITFDGKTIAVFKGLYDDCFNPNLGKDYVLTKLDKSGDTLLLLMAASDAAGSYTVMWFLQKDGYGKRLIDDCSDCGYHAAFDFFKNN